MRPIHMSHFHRPNWHLLKKQLHQMMHDPVFWSILIVALILIALMFLMAAQPALPQAEPYMPIYPYASW